MRRRAPRGSWNVPPPPPANHCRALVLVDGTAIRKKIKRNYEKALRDLANSRQQLDEFNQTDLPRYTRWFNGHFGALLTELRELTQKIAVDGQLIFQVESEMLFGAASPARAYQRVMEQRENPPPPPGFSGRDGQNSRENGSFGGPFDDPPADFTQEDEDFDGQADPFDEFFDEFFGDLFGRAKPNGRNHSRHWDTPTRRPNVPHGHSRIKDLYRKLVRRLHPDAQAKMTAQKTEWWHQAQAAYEAGDADKLEVILTLCEIEDNGTAAGTSASLLHRITAQLKHSILEFKRQLRERRRESAWNFSKRTDHETLEITLRAAITRDLENLRAQWRESQAVIAGWKAAAERLKPSRPRKRRPQPQDMDCPF